MPIKQASKKHLRQTKKRTERNDLQKVQLKSLLKQTRRQIESKKTEGLDELIKQTVQTLAKAAKNNIIKDNTASRLTSRLMQNANKLKKQ